MQQHAYDVSGTHVESVFYENAYNVSGARIIDYVDNDTIHKRQPNNYDEWITNAKQHTFADEVDDWLSNDHRLPTVNRF